MSSSETERLVVIVAIDGPSGVGKSTVARQVGAALGIPYLSTGAMYRAIALEVLRAGANAEDRASIEEIARRADLALVPKDGVLRVELNGVDAGKRAYSLEVSQVTSRISTYPGVRERLVALQRAAARRHGAVLEGRDIGTRVFPETPHKFFLEASAEVRAHRRWLQLGGEERAEVRQSEVLREVLDRDERDSTRSESPLRREPSYYFIDTDELSVEEVVVSIVDRVRGQARNSADEPLPASADEVQTPEAQG